MTKAARDKDRALANSSGDGVTHEDAVAAAEEDVAMADAEEAEAFGSKTIVIHPGSQNLRIGLATDALPKTIPMVIARRCDHSEADGEPRPKRMKRDDLMDDEDDAPNTWFGDDVRLRPTTFIFDLHP